MYLTIARRTATLIAVPVLLAALTACGSKAISIAAAPAGNDTTSTANPTPTAKVPPASWAGTTSFLQIKSSGEANGIEYLEVREAKKKSKGQDYETTPLDGPWVKVTMNSVATNVPKQGIGGDFGQLAAALAGRSSSEIAKGFDVAFNKKGQVSQVVWLYVPTREFADAIIATWVDSTQFLQIKSARKQGNTTYLKVRPAEKEYLGESFETKTIGGPWIEVTMSALADNVPMDGDPGDADALRSMLTKRQASSVDEGFDVTFAGNGQVSQVTWLYGSER